MAISLLLLHKCHFQLINCQLEVHLSSILKFQQDLLKLILLKTLDQLEFAFHYRNESTFS